MPRKSFGASIESSTAQPDTGHDPDAGVDSDAFKDALARWPSGVCIVAVRDDTGRVHGTTVGSFGSVSAEPPRIMFTLGAGAQVLPFLEEGTRFFVNVLSAEQQRLASAFADPFPVGPSPFPAEGDPVIDGIHAGLGCRVVDLVEVASSRVVIGHVESTLVDSTRSPLLYYLRDYRRIADTD